MPEAYQDEQGVWNPIYIGTLCFACNTDWFCTDGNADADLLGRSAVACTGRQIVMATPKSLGTSYTTLATLVQMRGEDKAWGVSSKIRPNVGLYTRSGVEPAERVKTANTPSVSCSRTTPSVRRWMAIPLRCAVRQTAPGYEIGACALVRNAPEQERENARIFIDWLTSSRGEECYIEAKAAAFRQTAPPAQRTDCRRWTRSSSSPTI